jgi:predicted  nucleic acid-binding Zn-ribbon protein
VSARADERTASATTLALGQLRTLVTRLGEEAAGFRRRALQAEARVKELEERLSAASAGSPVADAGTLARLAALEEENADMRQRLAQAAERTQQLLDRTRFLRQQQEQEEEPQA